MDRNIININGITPLNLSGGGFLRGAHHPHCNRYSNHLLWFFGHPLCLGCTCLYLGVSTGFFLSLIIDWTAITFISWVFIHVTIIVPTSLQPWIQNKAYKILARYMLGIGSATYLISGLLWVNPPFSVWIYRLLIVIIFLIIYRLLKFIRTRFTPNPCTTCPLGVFPTCEWNLPRLISENSEFDLIIPSDNATEIIHVR